MERKCRVGQRFELYEILPVENGYPDGTFTPGQVRPGAYAGPHLAMVLDNTGEFIPLFLVPLKGPHDNYNKECRKVGAVTIKSLKSDTNV